MPEAPPTFPGSLIEALAEALEDPPWDLFQHFLEHLDSGRECVSTLFDTAEGTRGENWESRRIALLMLQYCFSRMPLENRVEIETFLDRLGLRDPQDSSRVLESVLEEGYSDTDIRAFAAQLQRRMRREEKVFRRLCGPETSAEDWSGFLEVASRECKLVLGRYLLKPKEVVRRILTLCRTTQGMAELAPAPHPFVEEEADRALARLPAYEGEILRRLRDLIRVFWVSPSTSARLYSLVEYPMGSVVLVVKPPGSDIEFEIKRAGMRGSQPLKVIFRRDGRLVPQSHRLQGASMGSLLRWEAGAAAFFSVAYRMIHDDEAPLCLTICRRAIENVPTQSGEESLLRYWTDPDIYGDGYDEMRVSLRESVNAYARETGLEPPKAFGSIGETGQIISQLTPGQSILCGTTAFRLDRLLELLSEDGPERYFSEGLGIEPCEERCKRFADDLLEEVLGDYVSPECLYKDQRQYVDAALEVAANRKRADDNHLSAADRLGKFWGTLFALRGYSRGESLVPRNVGLRSRWEAGGWKVEIIFMDHDDLHLSGRRHEFFDPMVCIPNMIVDENHIWGGLTGREMRRGSLSTLEGLYRVEDDVALLGRSKVLHALKAAYERSHRELKTNPRFGELFHPSFVDRISDWDGLVSEFLQIEDSPQDLDRWRVASRESLAAKGYEDFLVHRYIEAVERFSTFLSAYRFLYLEPFESPRPFREES